MIIQSVLQDMSGLTVGKPQRFFSSSYFDQPVAESTSFLAVPSLGALVPGWLLLVPKNESACLAHLTPSQALELKVFAARLTEKVGSIYGPVVQFEHGATSSGSATGCGVDHAHLHLVPIDHNAFKASVAEEGRKLDLRWFAGDLPTQASDELDYLWYSVGLETRFAYPAHPVSQFFRRCVARALGVPDVWNYREYPQHDVVKSTIEALAA